MYLLGNTFKIDNIYSRLTKKIKLCTRTQYVASIQIQSMAASMCSYTKQSTQTWSPTQQTGKSLSISQRLVSLAQSHKDEQVSLKIRLVSLNLILLKVSLNLTKIGKSRSISQRLVSLSNIWTCLTQSHTD